MNEIDKLAWLYIQNKKLLGARSHNQSIFYIPGGKREESETDKTALMREIKEELSVDLISDSIRYAETFRAQAHGKPVDTIVKMTCYFADFTGEIKVNAEIAEIYWLTYADKPKCSLVAQIIMDWLKSKKLIE